MRLSVHPNDLVLRSIKNTEPPLGRTVPLYVLIDYDNVDETLRRAGPVALARLIFARIPAAVSDRHTLVTVRMYGGWRQRGVLTRNAQSLTPDIRANTPTIAKYSSKGITKQIRLEVELADTSIGLSLPLSDTLVSDRNIRKFHANRSALTRCTNTSSCGLRQFSALSYRDACAELSCEHQLGDLLVRDEQKMVDTLLVSDAAYVSLFLQEPDVVIVSSDNDMWPGVMQALRTACKVTHIHTKSQRKTPNHLLQSLTPAMMSRYQQLSV